MKVIFAKLVLAANVFPNVGFPCVFVLPKKRLEPPTGVAVQLPGKFQSVLVVPDHVAVLARADCAVTKKATSITPIARISNSEFLDLIFIGCVELEVD